MKEGKNIDNYYVIKALQLFIEGVSLREIERLIGVSHVSVMNWVKKFNLKAPENNDYHPTYKVMRHDELISYMSNRENTKNTGMIITELGDKYMLIKWERLKGKK
jgi:transposase